MTNIKSRFKNFINNNPGSFFILSLSAAIIISQIPQIALLSSVMLLPAFYFGFSYLKDIIVAKFTTTVSNVKDKAKEITGTLGQKIENAIEVIKDYSNMAMIVWKAPWEALKFCTFLIRMVPTLIKDPVRAILKIMNEAKNVDQRIMNGTVGKIKDNEEKKVDINSAQQIKPEIKASKKIIIDTVYEFFEEIPIGSIDKRFFSFFGKLLGGGLLEKSQEKEAFKMKNDVKNILEKSDASVEDYISFFKELNLNVQKNIDYHNSIKFEGYGRNDYDKFYETLLFRTELTSEALLKISEMVSLKTKPQFHTDKILSERERQTENTVAR